MKSFLLTSLIFGLAACNGETDLSNAGESKKGTSEQGKKDSENDQGTDEPAWVNSMYLTCQWDRIENISDISFGCALASTDPTLLPATPSYEWQILNEDGQPIGNTAKSGSETSFSLHRNSYSGLKVELTFSEPNSAPFKKMFEPNLPGLEQGGTLTGCLNSETELSTCFENQIGLLKDNQKIPNIFIQSNSVVVDLVATSAPIVFALDKEFPQDVVIAFSAEVSADIKSTNSATNTVGEVTIPTGLTTAIFNLAIPPTYGTMNAKVSFKQINTKETNFLVNVSIKRSADPIK